MLNNPANIAHGSLGEICKDDNGRLYTKEYYASRYWFETEREAKQFIIEIIRDDYGFKLGEIYLESLDPVFIRNEWTVLVNIDVVQMRMNDIAYGG